MAEDYEEALRANLKKLSSIGTNIEEMRERPLKKIQEHEIVLHRILNLCKGFITREELKEMRASLDALQERLEGVEKSLKEVGAKAERGVKVDFAPLEERLRGVERSLKESVKRLSEVDSEIIEELGKVQGILAAEDSGSPRFELPVERERSRPPARERPPEKEARAAPRPRRGLEDLERERDKLLAMLGKFTEDYNGGLISKEAYEETLRGGEERLGQIEAEIAKLQ